MPPQNKDVALFSTHVSGLADANTALLTQVASLLVMAFLWVAGTKMGLGRACLPNWGSFYFLEPRKGSDCVVVLEFNIQCLSWL